MTKPTMYSYIYEQPVKLAQILENYPQQFKNLLDLTQTKEWLILGTGSSINAAKSAKIYIEKQANVRIEIEEPFNFQHYEKSNPQLDLILGISQSGQSTSTIDAIKKLRAQNTAPSIAVTSITGSEITAETDVTLDIGCGRERVGYVTLGFSATVLTLMLFGLHLGVKKGLITFEEEAAELADFKEIIQTIERSLAQSEHFFEMYRDEFKTAPRFTTVAYGPAVGTAKEMETKFSETVRVPSQGIELEAFMHGPYLEVNPEHRIFFLEVPSPNLEKEQLLKAYEQKCTDFIYTITTEKTTAERTLSLDISVDEFKAPLILMIPLQILAWLIAKEKNIDLTKRIYTDFAQQVKSKTQVQDYV